MEKNALLQEIIACMAENGDYSQTELDEFCSIFFESIEAGLLADKYVKIKGFGTFKLINVSDRESINVILENAFKSVVTQRLLSFRITI